MGREVEVHSEVPEGSTNWAGDKNLVGLFLGSVGQLVRQRKNMALLKTYVKWDAVKFSELGERQPVSNVRPIFNTKVRWTANSLSPGESLFGLRLSDSYINGVQDSSRLAEDARTEERGWILKRADKSLFGLGDTWKSKSVTGSDLASGVRRAMAAICCNAVELEKSVVGRMLSRAVLAEISGYVIRDHTGELGQDEQVVVDNNDLYRWVSASEGDLAAAKTHLIQFAGRVTELVNHAWTYVRVGYNWEGQVGYLIGTVRLAIKVLLALERGETATHEAADRAETRRLLGQMMSDVMAGAYPEARAGCT